MEKTSEERGMGEGGRRLKMGKHSDSVLVESLSFDLFCISSRPVAVCSWPFPSFVFWPPLVRSRLLRYPCRSSSPSSRTPLSCVILHFSFIIPPSPFCSPERISLSHPFYISPLRFVVLTRPPLSPCSPAPFFRLFFPRRIRGLFFLLLIFRSCRSFRKAVATIEGPLSIDAARCLLRRLPAAYSPDTLFALLRRVADRFVDSEMFKEPAVGISLREHAGGTICRSVKISKILFFQARILPDSELVPGVRDPDTSRRKNVS